MDMNREFLADLEREVVSASEKVLPQEIEVQDDFWTTWKAILDKSRVGTSNVYRIDLDTLDPDIRGAIEKDWDLIYSAIRKVMPDTEIRLTGCKPCRIRELTQADVGSLREISGMIVRFDEDRRVKVIRDSWVCSEGHATRSGGPMTKDKCTAYTTKLSVRGKSIPCGAPLVRQVFSECKLNDLFVIRVEEKAIEENPDLEASAIDIIFEGRELVREVLAIINSTDKYVKISGIVKLTPVRYGDTGMLMCLDGSNIEHVIEHKTNRYDELVRRNIPPERMRSHVMKLARSFAPHISGRLDLKMGLMCTAVGGCFKKIDPAKIRGEINTLILGSPATGKTQCLKYMERVHENTIYVSGRLASPVGLTAGVMGGDPSASGLWAKRRQVFMGAYGQAANNGMVCLDEIHKRQKVDLEVLSEALDDNSELVLAKSGLFKKIPLNCGSLHAGNPRTNGGMYDKRLSLVEQMDDSFWLLSRYDLVFVLVQDDQKDRFASLRHSVSETYRRAKLGRSVAEPPTTAPLTHDEERFTLEGEFYPPDYMAAEIAFLRQQKPTLEVGSPQWQQMLEFWERFSQMKMQGVDNVDVFDQRKFNSIVRVSESVAKLYRSPVVTMEHMQEAINLFRVSISNIAHIPSPDLGYVRFAKWLIEQFMDECYYCAGRGCEACGSLGGRYIPIAFADIADYPYAEEARNSWDYMVAMGALVRMEESLGGQSYRITDVCREIAQGGWRESEEKDIAMEALAMMRSDEPY